MMDREKRERFSLTSGLLHAATKGFFAGWTLLRSSVRPPSLKKSWTDGKSKGGGGGGYAAATGGHVEVTGGHAETFEMFPNEVGKFLFSVKQECLLQA